MEIRVNGRAALLALVIGGGAIAAYWHWSPYLALRSMQAAAIKGDADALSAHVDYPRLRESFKGQFKARMASVMKPAGDERNPFAALGAALGMAMADQMVDALVRPEALAKAFANAKLQPPGAPASTAGADGPARGVSWRLERKGVDRVVIYGEESGQVSTAPRLGFVLDRGGFADWKLTEVRLPQE